MVTAILEIIVIVLKIAYSIFQAVMAWKQEERDRFEQRIRTLTAILKDAIVNKEEVLNEKDYLSNLEWEKQERYKAYKQACIEVLNLGGGINELKLQTVMGFNLRLADKINDTIAILIKDLKIEEKSMLIAKLLTDI